MISPSGIFTLVDASKITYQGDIVTTYRYHPLIGGGQYLITVLIVSDALDIETFKADGTFAIAASTVAAYTGTGTTQGDKLHNAVEQAVADYLAAIGDNSGITFTVS